MRRLFVLLVLAALAESTFAAKPLCESLLAKAHEKPKRLRPTKQWIRANALLGYERTYTSPILETLFPTLDYAYFGLKKQERHQWKNFSRSRAAQLELRSILQKFKTKTKEPIMSSEHADEILRFFKEVLGARSVVLHIGKKEKSAFAPLGYRAHAQPFTFEVTTKWSKKVLVTLEQSCIEVNQAPVTRDELRAAWQDIEDSASINGFQGYIQGGYSSGGGTHLHLGWINENENLWVERPDLLANFLEFPLQRPEVFHLLHSEEDGGANSSAASPFDLDTAYSFLIYEFLLRLKSLHLHKATSAEVMHYYKNNLNQELKSHDRFISLKNIDEHNPRIELRLLRSFSSLDEMEANADFWLAVVHKLNSRHPYAHDTNAWLRRFETFESISPLVMLDRNKKLLNELRLSSKTQRILLGINGIDQTDQPYYSNLFLHPKSRAKIHRAATYLPSNHLTSRVEIEWSNQDYPKSAKAKIIYSNDEVFVEPNADGGFSGTFDYFKTDDRYALVLVYDSKNNELVDRFAVKIEGGQEEYTDISFGIPVEEAFSDPKFFERFFIIGLRYLSGYKLDQDLRWDTTQQTAKPNSKTIKNNQAIIDADLGSFPELRDYLSSERFIEGQHIPVRVNLSQSSIFNTFNAVYINGVKVIPRLHHSPYGTMFDVSNVRDFFPDLKVSDNKLAMHVLIEFKNTKGELVVKNMLSRWDFKNQVHDIGGEIKFKDDQEKLEVMLNILRNMRSQYSESDNPSGFAQFLQKTFPEYGLKENKNSGDGR
jgi:hypothetical protein